MGMLDALIYGIRHVFAGTGTLPDRDTIEFVGAVVADDPANKRTTVTFPTALKSPVTGSPGASAVSAWFIDSVNGHDTADGLTTSTALQSIPELFARLGDQVIDGQTVFVNLSGSFPNNLSVKARFANGGGLAFVGTKTVVTTGTIGAVTPWNAATGVIGSYSLVGTPSIAPHVGRFMRLNAGPNTGNKTPIAKDLGNGVFRGNWASQATGSTFEPSVGDTVDIYTVTKVGGNVDIDAQGNGFVFFQDCDLGMPGQDHSTICRSGGIQFIACIIRGCDVLKAIGDCSISLSLTYDFRVYGQAQVWSNVHMTAGGSALDARSAGRIIIYGPTLVQSYGVAAGHQLEGAGEIVISDPADGGGPLAIADYPVDAVTVFPGSQLVARDRLFIRDAAAGGLTGYHAFSGGGLYYQTGEPPVAYGTAPTTFANIGGTIKVAGAIPFIEPTNGAAIVVSQ